MQPARERRVRRTLNKQLAIQWFLQSAILRQGIQGLVLGSRDGLLVAQAGGGVGAEEAAAFAPYVFHDKWDFPEPVESSYFVEALPLTDTTLYLFVVGGTGPGSRTVEGTKAGIRRILDEHQG
ncbi:MAG: hypothetical protein RBU30_06425 [Polyangia bacterium]|nr:hypothetical protein [Polyangia bacterium]